MPFEGAQLDELLSGYLDGELADSEAAQVDKLLKEAPEAVARLRSLEALRGDLQRLGQQRRAAAPGLPSDFAARVVAASQLAAASQPAAAGLAKHSDSHRSDSDPLHVSCSAADGMRRSPQSSWSSTRRLALVGLAVAASIAVVINLPALLNNISPNAQSQNGDSVASNEKLTEPRQNSSVDAPANPFTGDSFDAESALARSEVSPKSDDKGIAENGDAENGDVQDRDNRDKVHMQYVDRWSRQLTMVMVVDISLSPEAMSNDYVTNVFAAHSIQKTAPVLADAKLLDVLEGAQALGESAKPDASDAYIYFVHADSRDIDQLVQTFVDDVTNIPDFRMDLAFDAPANQLMERIVDSSEGRFSIEQSFVAPVSDEAGIRQSPFGGISPQGKLVARRGSGRQPAGGAGNGVAGADGKSTFLLLVRTPQK